MRLKDEQVSHYIGVIRDASRHIQDKAAIKAAHDSLQKSLENLNELVITDPLTGIHNRRYFASIFAREWQICRREKRPLTLALLDIDHFKSYNDSFGHKAGDECLVEIAKIIQKGFSRGSDMAARYGGEEFVVLCPRDEPEDVVEQVRRVSARIKNAGIQSGNDSMHDVVTISAGVAWTNPNEGGNQDDLFERADALLYKAKSAGRNQVLTD